MLEKVVFCPLVTIVTVRPYSVNGHMSYNGSELDLLCGIVVVNRINLITRLHSRIIFFSQSQTLTKIIYLFI